MGGSPVGLSAAGVLAVAGFSSTTSLMAVLTSLPALGPGRSTGFLISEISDLGLIAGFFVF